MYFVPSPNTTFSTGVSTIEDVLNIAVLVIVEYLEINLCSRLSLVSSLIKLLRTGLRNLGYFHG